ncbi:hypothetical protein TNIN_475841 [Trichonephila inaurata madagascariensis]|uniref:Uncharacterized protein n=1 Tax=Trichonephila inaurata madagascariensis TaxID=2747483 RepID=A0A8X6IW38_9ARAC|nr:hypothetical protein TNIN_475841 [Trichonephila inaurata madagascariensis]
MQDDFPKPYPKWNPLDSPSRSHNRKTDKTFTFPRIFTVTVEKLQTCPKVLSCGQMIFELFDFQLLNSCLRLQESTRPINVEVQDWVRIALTSKLD